MGHFVTDRGVRVFEADDSHWKGTVADVKKENGEVFCLVVWDYVDPTQNLHRVTWERENALKISVSPMKAQGIRT